MGDRLLGPVPDHRVGAGSRMGDLSWGPVPGRRRGIASRGRSQTTGPVPDHRVGPGSRMGNLPRGPVPDHRVGPVPCRPRPPEQVPDRVGSPAGPRSKRTASPLAPGTSPGSVRSGSGAGAAGCLGPAPTQICRRITVSDSSPGPAQPAQPAGLFQSGRAGEGFPAGTGPARAGLCRAPRRPASRAAGTAPLRSRYRSPGPGPGPTPTLAPHGSASCCSALYFSVRCGTARLGPVRFGSPRCWSAGR